MRHIKLSILYLSFPSDQSNAMLTGDVRDKVAMGVANDNCDTGAKMLEVDWLDDPAMYKCQSSDSWGGSGYKTDYIVECDDVPKDHSPKHFCMNDTISYDTKIPTYGDHRPIWPMFGEYKYVPTQRWSHNIEHGAVVMLYHPCTDKDLVDELRSLVTGCIRKHIITPFT